MAQDSAARKSRIYRGYRAPQVVETGEGEDFDNVYNTSFTYDAVSGNVATITKVRIDSDGIIVTKTITFTYDTDGNVTSITQDIS